jgi:hypothetical protein
MLYFFRSLIDFDWIKGHLISDRVGSGRVRIGSDQFDFLKKIDRFRFGSDLGPDGSGRVLPPLATILSLGIIGSLRPSFLSAR